MPLVLSLIKQRAEEAETCYKKIGAAAYLRQGNAPFPGHVREIECGHPLLDFSGLSASQLFVAEIDELLEPHAFPSVQNAPGLTKHVSF